VDLCSEWEAAPATDGRTRLEAIPEPAAGSEQGMVALERAAEPTPQAGEPAHGVEPKRLAGAPEHEVEPKQWAGHEAATTQRAGVPAHEAATKPRQPWA
jgi:hypothetical protein